MANYSMVSPEEARLLGLSGTMVEDDELEAARHRAAATADAALFEDGPQDAQEAPSAPLDVEVEAGVASRPRRARRAAGGGDGGQFVADDPATPGVNEAYEQGEA